MIAFGSFRAGPSFVLRTPALPLDNYLRWTRGQRVGVLAQEVSSSATAGLQELREWVVDPVVREALFIASPSLHDAVDRWLVSLNWQADSRMVRTLLSYRARMSSRSTPFGIFAKYSVGTVGSATVLRLEGRSKLRRSVRLDFGLIEELARRVADAPEMRDSMPLVLNDTVHRVGGRVCYVEAKQVGEVRRHEQVSLDDSTEFRIIESTAGRTTEGATRAGFAAALTAFDQTIATEDALAFVEELCSADLLRPALLPPLTGDDSLRVLEGRTRCMPGASRFAAHLADLKQRLTVAERTPLGEAIPRYREIVDFISSSFGVATTPGKALQIDLIDESEGIELSTTLVSRVARGLELFHRIFGDSDPTDLQQFATAFAERYEYGEVPLLEALDPDIGVGYGVTSEVARTALVRGLDRFQPRQAQRAASAPPANLVRQTALMRIAADAIASGSTVVELTTEDIEELTIPNRAPLPDAFTALVIVAKEPKRDPSTAEGEPKPQLFLGGTIGPSALRYFGRFCQRDERLMRMSSELARAEEALRPECDFAEVVHLPDGRTGNVAARPLIRRWELPYLAPSGADPAHTIRPQDLLVSVRGDEVILRSSVTGRRVLPRLASAHFMAREGLLPLYRFLGAIQAQGCCEGLEWRWGDAERLTFVPRVQRDGIVYTKARWRLRWTDVSTSADTHAGLRQFREKWRVPAVVELEEGDNRLLLDLTTQTGCATLLHRLESAGAVRLVELWPPASALEVTAPDGDLTHELLLPFTRLGTELVAETTSAGTASMGSADRKSTTGAPDLRRSSPAISRRFALGSQWAFLKLYVGLGAQDRLLIDEVRPTIEELRARDPAIKFFFVRYADPEWHLRLRVREGHLAGAHMEALIALNARLTRSSLVWQSQFATYERETERYGGAGCIDEAESWFSLDAEFALATIARSRASTDAAMREALVLAAIDDLLIAVGSDPQERRRFAETHRDRFVTRLTGVGQGQASLRRALSRQARELGPVHAALSQFLDRGIRADMDDMALRSIFARRSDGARRLLRIVDPATDNPASGVRADVLASLVHMSVNRLVSGRHVLHELGIYDALARRYARETALTVSSGGRPVPHAD